MIRMRRVYLLLLALVLAAAGARAETNLTVSDAVKYALKNNLSLGRDALDLEAKKRSADSSYSLLYPSASVGAGLSHSGSISDGTNLAYGSLSVSMSLSQTIPLEMKALTQEYEAGLLSYEQASRSLELEVREAFNAILLYEARLNLALQNEEREQKSYAQVKTKYGAGLASELDLLTAQVAFEEKGPEVESARTALEDALASFRLLLGLPAGEDLSLSGSLDGASRVDENSVNAALEASRGKENLSIMSLKKSLDSAKTSEKAAELNVMAPSLSVSGRFYPEYVFGTGTYADASSVSLGLSLPLDGLIPGSSAKTSLEKAKDNVKKAESLLQSGQLESESTIASSIRAIKSAAASLITLKSNVDLAQKKYDLTNTAYQKGLKQLSDVEDAASSLDSAKVNFLSQEYTLLAKSLELENELGLDFGTIGR